MKTTPKAEIPKEKHLGWVPVAVIGALQTPAIYLSIILITLMLGFLNIDLLIHPLIFIGSILLTLIALTIATSFILRKLNFQHPYKIVTIGTLIFYILSSLTMAQIAQLADKSSLSIGTPMVLLVETILGAASFLIAYSLTKN
ncbi:MAG TPA: hypothetical protein VLG67_03330 [Candidatus Saccharimonadales bacterium]|nr:hypothetical protein [Candidatus Saccharimonadales bacterium]